MTRSVARTPGPAWAPGFGLRRATLTARHYELLGRAAADSLAVVTAVFLAGRTGGAGWVALSCAVALGCAAALGLYRTRFAQSALAELPRLLLSGGLAVGAGAGAAWLFAAGDRWAVLAEKIAAAQLMLVAVMFAARALVYAIERGQRRRGRLLRRAVIIGSAPQARRLAVTAIENPVFGLWPTGVVGKLTLAELDELVRVRHVDEIVLAAGGTLPGPVDRVRVWRVIGAGPPAGSGDHVLGIPLTRLDATLSRPAKRAMDLVAAAVLLVVLSPVMLACALAVRAETGPGVLFRQRRVGAGGREFILLKFRTLRPADDEESATRWNVHGDPRLGRAGRFLRATSLDELPQLFNILAGQMSLVGPRPERPYFAARFAEEIPEYAARHRMPPGLTGLAQVHGLRGDTSIEARARLDNLYIDSWSPWLDVQIMIRTVAALTRSGG